MYLDHDNFVFRSLYPGDLVGFTRKPLFLIVDSHNSTVFHQLPRLFGQPLVVLMSPQDTPAAFQGNTKKNSRGPQKSRVNNWFFTLKNNISSTVFNTFSDAQHNGSLFTLFLHSPLTAFCYICNVLDIPIHHWERSQSYIDRFVTEASRLFTRSRIGKSSYKIPEWRHTSLNPS